MGFPCRLAHFAKLARGPIPLKGREDSNHQERNRKEYFEHKIGLVCGEEGIHNPSASMEEEDTG